MKLALKAAVYLGAAVIAGNCLMLLGTRALAADPQAPATPAQAPEAPAAPAAPTQTPASTTPASAATADAAATTLPVSTPMDAGMRAYIDPETGQLTSLPPDGIPHTDEPALQNPPELIEEFLPDGSVVLDLQGTLQDYMVLQFDANGALVMRCTNDPAAALPDPPPAPAREDR